VENVMILDFSKIPICKLIKKLRSLLILVFKELKSFMKILKSQKRDLKNKN